MSSSDFLQNLAFAISLGSMYGLIAIGYTIVYGVLGLINIAHGDFFMLSAFIAMWTSYRYHWPWPVGILLGLVLVPLLGVTVERIAYRPLRDHKMSAFTSTVAVAFFLESMVVVFFTARSNPFPQPELVRSVFYIGKIGLPAITIITMAVTAVLVITLSYIVTKTKFGMAMRALSRDDEATRLMGVDTNRIISLSFGLATVFAAVAAFMWGFRFNPIDAYVGVMPGLKAFVAAVIGGIGNIPGALVGGIFLGFAEIMIVAFFPTLTGWRDVIAYFLLISFLLFRPGGVFNVKVKEEKV